MNDADLPSSLSLSLSLSGWAGVDDALMDVDIVFAGLRHLGLLSTRFFIFVIWFFVILFFFLQIWFLFRRGCFFLLAHLVHGGFRR